MSCGWVSEGDLGREVHAALLALSPAVGALDDRVLLPERIAQWAAITPDAGPDITVFTACSVTMPAATEAPAVVTEAPSEATESPAASSGADQTTPTAPTN